MGADLGVAATGADLGGVVSITVSLEEGSAVDVEELDAELDDDDDELEEFDDEEDDPDELEDDDETDSSSGPPPGEPGLEEESLLGATTSASSSAVSPLLVPSVTSVDLSSMGVAASSSFLSLSLGIAISVDSFVMDSPTII